MEEIGRVQTMEQNMVMADEAPTVPARHVVAMEPDRAAVAETLVVLKKTSQKGRVLVTRSWEGNNHIGYNDII